MDRFSCIQTADRMWMVWDNRKAREATLDGKMLVGMTKTRAEVARDLLMRIEANKGSALSRFEKI